MKHLLIITLIIAASEGTSIKHHQHFSVFVQHFLLKGKVFERCEFARELVNNQGFARATVGNWVCLANVSRMAFIKLTGDQDLSLTISFYKIYFSV